MKNLIALALALVCVLCLVGCNEAKENENDVNAVFQGKIIEINDGTMLVEPLQGYPEAEHCELVSVVIQNMTSSSKPEMGDIVEITYNGSMTEEAPPSPNGIEKIVVIEGAE